MRIITTLVVFVCCSGLIQADTESDGYSGEVIKLFEDLHDYGDVLQAKQKMDEFTDEKCYDRKYAIALINFYTQDEPFYSNLNEQMRNEYPDDDKDVWRKAGQLVNDAIDLLGKDFYERVYRGCLHLDNPPVVGSTYEFKQIISTSLDPDRALSFSDCKTGHFFDIKNIRGLNAVKYSAFRREEEVILKSGDTFDVLRIENKKYYLDGKAQHVTRTERLCVNSVQRISSPGMTIVALFVLICLEYNAL